MFYFYSEGKKLRLPIKQIIYAEILNHDLYITTNGWGTVHSRMTLAAFLEKMPDNFIRIHHSYVIQTTLWELGIGSVPWQEMWCSLWQEGCRKRLRSILCRKERLV